MHNIVNNSPESPFFDFFTKHYRVLAIAVLALAALNLTYRLGRESVNEWDEALYATSAWEMIESGNLVGTTFDGQLDYYNSKPPLTVWFIAASFWAFGVNLVSLRAWSVVFAWLTVAVLQVWTKRAFGPPISIVSSLVLGTAFGFLHLHSGRSANPDALLTLLILLCVMVLWSGQRQPWHRAWLGPLLAGVFLLKGMAVLLPVVLIVATDVVASRSGRPQWKPNVVAALSFILAVGAWTIARWRVDGWLFFERMVNQDLVALSLTPLDGRGGGPFYYLDVLQRQQYDWLLACVGAAILGRQVWKHTGATIREALTRRDPDAVLVVAWASVTLLVPTVLQTKLFWYLNPFYPVFAVLVALLLTKTAADLVSRGHAGRAISIGLLILGAVGTAEARSYWHLHRVTNLDTSAQGMLLELRGDYTGRRVCRDRLHIGEAFVVKAMMRSRYHLIDPSAVESATARSGDVFLLSRKAHNPRMRLVGQADGHYLYEVD